MLADQLEIIKGHCGISCHDSLASFEQASVHHHRPYGLAALHQFEAFVDLVQTQCMGDEVVDVDLAVHIPVDDLGNIGTAACAAECRAFPFASGNQLEGAGRSEEHTLN